MLGRHESNKALLTLVQKTFWETLTVDGLIFGSACYRRDICVWRGKFSVEGFIFLFNLHKILGIQVNTFENKLKVGQHSDHRQFAGVAYYGLYHQHNESIFNTLSENIYFNLLGIALTVFRQFQLELENQFYFRLTLISFHTASWIPPCSPR